MAKNYYDITLALAGICQSARLVQQLAHQGHCDADALHVSLNSVIDLNPGSTLGVFGGSETNLRLGLETLLGVLNASNRQGLNAELTRYTLSLMVLALSTPSRVSRPRRRLVSLPPKTPSVEPGL
ncbi:DUF489 family protein, partial [Enterobacter hormaechei subsp. steigerwaltii]|nr:DUF489 family protein [Enterobacter hormaechei subsp. steigerwaltii]